MSGIYSSTREQPAHDRSQLSLAGSTSLNTSNRSQPIVKPNYTVTSNGIATYSRANKSQPIYTSNLAQSRQKLTHSSNDVQNVQAKSKTPKQPPSYPSQAMNPRSSQKNLLFSSPQGMYEITPSPSPFPGNTNPTSNFTFPEVTAASLHAPTAAPMYNIHRQREKDPVTVPYAAVPQVVAGQLKPTVCSDTSVDPSLSLLLGKTNIYIASNEKPNNSIDKLSAAANNSDRSNPMNTQNMNAPITNFGNISNSNPNTFGTMNTYGSMIQNNDGMPSQGLFSSGSNPNLNNYGVMSPNINNRGSKSTPGAGNAVGNANSGYVPRAMSIPNSLLEKANLNNPEKPRDKKSTFSEMLNPEHSVNYDNDRDILDTFSPTPSLSRPHSRPIGILTMQKSGSDSQWPSFPIPHSATQRSNSIVETPHDDDTMSSSLFSGALNRTMSATGNGRRTGTASGARGFNGTGSRGSTGTGSREFSGTVTRGPSNRIGSNTGNHHVGTVNANTFNGSVNGGVGSSMDDSGRNSSRISGVGISLNTGDGKNVYQSNDDGNMMNSGMISSNSQSNISAPVLSSSRAVVITVPPPAPPRAQRQAATRTNAHRIHVAKVAMALNELHPDVGADQIDRLVIDYDADADTHQGTNRSGSDNTRPRQNMPYESAYNSTMNTNTLTAADTMQSSSAVGGHSQDITALSEFIHLTKRKVPEIQIPKSFSRYTDASRHPTNAAVTTTFTNPKDKLHVVGAGTLRSEDVETLAYLADQGVYMPSTGPGQNMVPRLETRLHASTATAPAPVAITKTQAAPSAAAKPAPALPQSPTPARPAADTATPLSPPTMHSPVQAKQHGLQLPRAVAPIGLSGAALALALQPSNITPLLRQAKARNQARVHLSVKLVSLQVPLACKVLRDGGQNASFYLYQHVLKLGENHGIASSLLLASTVLGNEYTEDMLMRRKRKNPEIVDTELERNKKPWWERYTFGMRQPWEMPQLSDADYPEQFHPEYVDGNDYSGPSLDVVPESPYSNDGQLSQDAMDDHMNHPENGFENGDNNSGYIDPSTVPLPPSPSFLASRRTSTQYDVSRRGSTATATAAASRTTSVAGDANPAMSRQASAVVDVNNDNPAPASAAPSRRASVAATVTSDPNTADTTNAPNAPPALTTSSAPVSRRTSLAAMSPFAPVTPGGTLATASRKPSIAPSVGNGSAQATTSGFGEAQTGSASAAVSRRASTTGVVDTALTDANTPVTAPAVGQTGIAASRRASMTDNPENDSGNTVAGDVTASRRASTTAETNVSSLNPLTNSPKPAISRRVSFAPLPGDTPTAAAQTDPLSPPLTTALSGRTPAATAGSPTAENPIAQSPNGQTSTHQTPTAATASGTVPVTPSTPIESLHISVDAREKVESQVTSPDQAQPVQQQPNAALSPNVPATMASPAAPATTTTTATAVASPGVASPAAVTSPNAAASPNTAASPATLASPAAVTSPASASASATATATASASATAVASPIAATSPTTAAVSPTPVAMSPAVASPAPAQTSASAAASPTAPVASPAVASPVVAAPAVASPVAASSAVASPAAAVSPVPATTSVSSPVPPAASPVPAVASPVPAVASPAPTIASPVPTGSAAASPVPAGTTVASPIPVGSAASALPAGSTVASPVPASSTVASPVPTGSTVASPVPAAGAASPVPIASAAASPVVNSPVAPSPQAAASADGDADGAVDGADDEYGDENEDAESQPLPPPPSPPAPETIENPENGEFRENSVHVQDPNLAVATSTGTDTEPSANLSVKASQETGVQSVRGTPMAGLNSVKSTSGTDGLASVRGTASTAGLTSVRGTASMDDIDSTRSPSNVDGLVSVKGPVSVKSDAGTIGSESHGEVMMNAEANTPAYTFEDRKSGSSVPYQEDHAEGYSGAMHGDNYSKMSVNNPGMQINTPRTSQPASASVTPRHATFQQNDSISQNGTPQRHEEAHKPTLLETYRFATSQRLTAMLSTDKDDEEREDEYDLLTLASLPMNIQHTSEEIVVVIEFTIIDDETGASFTYTPPDIRNVRAKYQQQAARNIEKSSLLTQNPSASMKLQSKSTIVEETPQVKEKTMVLSSKRLRVPQRMAQKPVPAQSIVRVINLETGTVQMFTSTAAL